MSSIYSSSSSSNASSNPSELSLATITSVSTNTTNLTASDIAGPGRNVGKLYNLAGRALEKRFSRFVQKSRNKRGSGSTLSSSTRTSTSLSLQADATTPSTAPGTAISRLSISESLPPPSSAHGSSTEAIQVVNGGGEGDDSENEDELAINDEEFGYPPSPSIASTMDLNINYSSLTLSTNETASNIAGPGRLLGNLYSRGGRALESRINVVATLAGRGPDASCERIKTMMPKAMNLESSRLHQAAFRDFKGLFDLTVEKNGLDNEIKKLLSYSRSSIAATRQRALHHITNLSIEDTYLRGMFNAYGADKLLQDLKAREKKYRATDSDAFFPHLKKALVSISKNEVNDIVRRSERDEAGNSTDMFYDLVPYLKDQDQSFLALRHIKRTIQMMGRPDGPDFSFQVYSDMAERLSDLIYAFPSIVEWDCVDFICKSAFQAYKSQFRDGAPRFHETIAKWNTLLTSVMRYPHLLPTTTTYLVQMTDVDYLLDPANANPRISRSDFIALPDHSGLDPAAFTCISLYPSIILEMHTNPALLLEPSHPSSSTEICRVDGLNELRARYIQPQLQPLWQNLTKTPNMIFAEILAERSWSWNKLLFLERVPRPYVLRKLCKRLAPFVLRDGPARELAERRVRLVMQLDRYCRLAMTDALVELFSGSNSPAHMQMIPYSPKRSNLDFVVTDRDFCRWVYRHRSTDDGRMHIRKYPPYSRTNPCEICRQKGIWEEWLDGELTSSEVLDASPKQLMLLEVLPNQTFSAYGHVPVLVGVTDSGEREYLASALGTGVALAERREVPLGQWYTTVTDGARSVQFYDDSGAMRTAEHFWVFVLRYDTTEETEAKVQELGGKDVTSQCQWI